MALGASIRKHRERLGWTLEALSERSGVDIGTISALETRDSRRTQYAQALARALGLTVDQLYGAHPSNEGTVPVMEAISKEDRALLDDLAVLLPEDAEVWRAQIRAAAVKVRRLKTND